MANLKALVTVKQIPDKDSVEEPRAKLAVYEDKVVYSDNTLIEPVHIPYEEIKEVVEKHSIFDETGNITIITYKKKEYLVPLAKRDLISAARKIIESKISPIKEQKRINRLPLQYYFHHISIYASNLDLSEGFYYRLKFEKVYEYEDDLLNIIHVKNGYCILELFSYKSKKNGKKAEIETNIPLDGIKHFALKVPSIERAKKDITLKGISLHKDITEGKMGVKHFFLKDPDGTLVEIVEDNRDLDPYIVGSNHQSIAALP